MSGAPVDRVLQGVVRARLDPPRTAFHLVLGLLGVGLVWVGSLPGVPLVPLMGLGWLVALGALIWAIKLAVYRRQRRQGAVPPAGRWFLLAPVGGLLVAAVLVSGLAFDARWAASQASFNEAVVAAVDPGRASATTPGRVGLYRILGEPLVIDEAVFFHHPLGGGVFDDAGFAYLPASPTPHVEASFESLHTQQIDGPWYRWWSSW